MAAAVPQFRQGPPPPGPFQNGPPPQGPFQNGPPQQGPFQNGPPPSGSFRNGSPRPGPFQNAPLQTGPFQNVQLQPGRFQNGPPQPGPLQRGPFQNVQLQPAPAVPLQNNQFQPIFDGPGVQGPPLDGRQINGPQFLGNNGPPPPPFNNGPLRNNGQLTLGGGQPLIAGPFPAPFPSPSPPPPPPPTEVLRPIPPPATSRFVPVLQRPALISQPLLGPVNDFDDDDLVPVYRPPPVAPPPPPRKIVPAYLEPAYENDQPYSYQYGVQDDLYGTSFRAAEESDGDGSVEGSYSVLLPDGRTQHVTYRADDISGYVADVRYEGVAVYPPEPLLRKPAYQAVEAVPVSRGGGGYGR